MAGSQKQLAFGSVSLGDKFIFRTAEVLGRGYAGEIPRFEGQVLTVVGFRPRLVNNVIVCDPTGDWWVMPQSMVEHALRHQASQRKDTTPDGGVMSTGKRSKASGNSLFRGKQARTPRIL